MKTYIIKISPKSKIIKKNVRGFGHRFERNIIVNSTKNIKSFIGRNPEKLPNHKMLNS